MSIIHEALKKTGQPIMTEVRKTTPELWRKKSRSGIGPFIALGVIALISAPIVAPLLHNPAKTGNSEISVGSALPAASGNMKQQFAVEEAPLPILPNLTKPYSGRVPSFKLSGLVYSEGGSFCLINGKVVKVGEKVGDATVTAITPSGATLDFRGEKIALTNEG